MSCLFAMRATLTIGRTEEAMIGKPRKWWAWATRDEFGVVTGIRKDAPPEIKAEYEAYLKRKSEGKED